MSREILRRQLIAQLDGGQAYTPIEEAIGGVPPEMAGCKPEGILHTPWEILEHMRIAQWDILRFTTDPDHVTPPWPDEHWPKTDAPGDSGEWRRSVETFLRELREVRDLVGDPATDLFGLIPHGTGQTVLREILLVADHNAYHLGQLMLIRRALESTT